jgi:hypothetical protein
MLYEAITEVSLGYAAVLNCIISFVSMTTSE